MRLFYLLGCLTLTLIFSTETFAQRTVIMSNTAQDAVCTGTYYDAGGTNDYPASTNYTQTFTPSVGNRMQFVFSSFDLRNKSGYLYIYDGNSTSAPLIGTYTGNSSPGVVTSNSDDGTLTFSFVAGTNPKSGWVASIACVSARPRIITNPSDISVCPGSWVSFTAEVVANPAPYNVLWQISTNGGSSWSNASGTTSGTTTSSVFKIASVAAGNQGLYRAVFSNIVGSTNSGSASLTINAIVNKTVSPSTSVCYGTGTNITVSSSATNIVYQLRNDADNSPIGASQTGNGSTLNFPTGNLANTTTYNVLATNTFGCSAEMSVTPTVTVNPLPVVSVAANYCYGGGKIQLTANSSIPATYLWSNGATTQSILVDIAANYTVTATTATGCKATSSRMIAQELVVNGDFSAGNTSFTTGYGYNANANGLVPEGLYAVENDAHYSHPNFFGIDHTNGSGKFMVVNGSPLSAQPTVWEEVVNVTPNTTYYFAAWATSLNTVGNYAQLRFSINGVQIGTTANLSAGATSTAGPFNWSRFYGTWNSGTSTTARIYIIDNQIQRGGNDFGLDDISFGTLTPEAFTASVSDNLNGPVCEGGAVNFTTTLHGGLSPFTYSWTGPNSYSSTVQNPSIAASVAANSGIYNLSVTDGFGCPITIKDTVVINALPASKVISAQASSICTGTSTNIQVASADAGINYRLRDNSNNGVIGSPVNGFGFSLPVYLSTGNLTATTTFNVLATNNATGCSRQMGNPATVTVNPNATINLSSAASTNAQTPCINTAITNITYTIGGGGTGATVSGLPSGVTGSFSGNTFTISGSPTVTGNYSYSVNTTGTCSQTSVSGTITVKLNPTISLSSSASSTSQTICVNTSIANIAYAIGGGGTGATASGLPAGLNTSFNGGTFTISGNPSASGTFNYTVTTTGTCTQASLSGTIIVKPNASISLSSGSSSNVQSPCINTAITSITYSISGGGTGATVSGLPSGVTGSYNSGTFTISGTPSTTGTYNYTVNTTGTCSQASASGTITVKANPTISLSSSASTTAQSLCINTGIANITYTIGGGATGATVSGLPSGVNGSFSGSTFTISGTPSVSGNFNYTVTTSGSCVAASLSGTMTVKPNATISLSSAASSNAQTICLNSSITTITYAIAGGGSGATVSGLPSGVTGSFNAGTFTISGTPAATGTFNYTVNTTGTCSQVSASGSIIIKANATLNLTSAASTDAQSTCINSAITAIKYTIGGGATAATVSGLPSGVIGTFNTGSLTITGTPIVSGIFNYTVTTTGTCSQASLNGSITVNAIPTLAGITIAPVCAYSNATAIFTGMVPGSTNNTVSYKISGIVQSPLTGINADVTGTATFVTPQLTDANNGQVIEITGVTNGACSRSFSKMVTLSVRSSGTWLGAVSTDWFDANNWCGGVPTLTTNVLVPITATGYYPLITGTTNATTNNITIVTGASAIVDNGTLQIAGVISNNGKLTAGNGSIDMHGAAAQTIPARVFTGDSLLNLIVSNTSTVGVTLGGGVDVYGTVSFAAHNNQVLASGGFLNLKSTANGTAKVADLSNNNTNTNNKITGDVVVERYYPAKRAWRLVTAPVSSKRTMFNSWQVGGGHTTDLLHPAPAHSGTYITSKLKGPGTDYSLHYSLDSFNFATGQLTGVNDTWNTKYSDSTINPGTAMDNKGYFMFVRGDRTPGNIDTRVTSCNITTLRDTGALQTYTKVFSKNLSSNNMFMLVGNPYASPVDFGKINRSSTVLRKFWAWDPRLNVSLGSYVLVDGMSGSQYIIVPQPANPGAQPYGNRSQDEHIQSGQSVFVQASAPGISTLTFNESSKSAVTNNVFRPAYVSENTPAFRTNLYLKDADTSILADGVYAQYDNSFSNGIDDYDAVKFSNIAESFSILKNSKKLILERRPVLTATDTIFFNMANVTARNYSFEFAANGLSNNGLQGYLQDAYQNTSTVINMEGVTNVDFSVTKDAASKATNRFSVVFRTLAPLPVSFTNVKAYQKESDIKVEWSIENEKNMKQYEVERSTDGHSFSKIATIAASHNNNSTASYQSTDTDVSGGTYFYRIHSISITGEQEYSSIAKVTISKSELQNITIYPNPVVNGTINLQLTNQPKGDYGVRLTNKLGQVIMVKDIHHAGGSSTETLQLSKSLAHAGYQLEVTKPDSSKTSINVLY